MGWFAFIVLIIDCFLLGYSSCLLGARATVRRACEFRRSR